MVSIQRTRVHQLLPADPAQQLDVPGSLQHDPPRLEGFEELGIRHGKRVVGAMQRGTGSVLPVVLQPALPPVPRENLENLRLVAVDLQRPAKE